MQLSLPIQLPVSPDPSTNGVYSPEMALSSRSADPAEPATGSFENFMPQALPETKPAPPGVNPAGDQAASVLAAAALWLPAMQPVATAVPDLAATTGSARDSLPVGTQTASTIEPAANAPAGFVPDPATTPALRGTPPVTAATSSRLPAAGQALKPASDEPVASKSNCLPGYPASRATGTARSVSQAQSVTEAAADELDAQAAEPAGDALVAANQAGGQLDSSFTLTSSITYSATMQATGLNAAGITVPPAVPATKRSGAKVDGREEGRVGATGIRARADLKNPAASGAISLKPAREIAPVAAMPTFGPVGAEADNSAMTSAGSPTMAAAPVPVLVDHPVSADDGTVPVADMGATNAAVVPSATALDGSPIDPDLVRANNGRQPTVAAPSTTVSGQAEKFAAPALVASIGDQIVNTLDKKEILSAVHQLHKTASTLVGISVAQVSAVMSAANSNRTKAAAAIAAIPSLSVSVDRLPVLDTAVNAPVSLPSVREAIATVFAAVDAVDRHQGGESKSVDLQLRVGGENLALRVELKDGAVHTTFRTNSTELRSALTQEWHNMVSTVAGRDLRLADPVFGTTQSGGGATAFGSASQGAPQQRNQNLPESLTRAFGSGLADPELSNPVPAAAAALHSNSILHAFA